jgi:hypothetical protein
MLSGRPLRTSAFHSIGSFGAESDLSNILSLRIPSYELVCNVTDRAF